MTNQKRILLHAYHLLTMAISPLVYAYLVYRKHKGKEDTLRFGERLGKTNLSRPTGKVIWIHAASVGESVSVLPLIQRLLKDYTNTTVLLTTVTVNSAKIMAERLPAGAIHQFVPVDNWVAVRQFLAHWRPDIALWIESELWPSLIDCAAKQCPIVLVNARMSDDSYAKWKLVRSFSKAVLEKFTYVLGQTVRDTERYQELGANQAIYTGNIKYDAAPLPAEPKKLEEVRQFIGTRPVWLAASTHADEELKIARIHAVVKKSYPDLLTIIAPRHPKRAEEIIEAVGNIATVARRSIGEKITDKTDIYLADTIGELGVFYRAVPIVFIGGTLIPHGGQNPLEPARLDCAILFGPHMENFLEIKSGFLAKDAAICVHNTDELAAALQALLKQKEKQEKLAKHAAEVVKENAGAVDKVCSYIDLALKK